MKLYTELKNVLKHPFRYIKWRKQAVRIWSKGPGYEVASFEWIINNKQRGKLNGYKVIKNG